MFVLGLAAVVSAAAVPQTLVTIERSRARAAARYLSSRMAVARAQAVAQGAIVALRFDTTAAGITFTSFIDGNRNGVLTHDIASGVDRQTAAPARLGDLFAHVAIALAVPGSGTNPVQLSGGSMLLSFTPVGTATGGSVYVRGSDGSQFAIRILGPTARTRLQEYDENRHVWVDAR
jgi:Tfp pilus assembly protein FimT